MPARRVTLGVLAFVAAAYAAASARHLADPGRLFVVDSPILRTTPRLAPPGWCFVPRLICRVSEYPASQAQVRVELSGERAAASREGARVEVEAGLTYSIDPARVLDLHRTRGPDYEHAWLADLLRRETAARLAASSYDVVRTRDPGLNRAVRAAITGEAAADGVRIDGVRIVQIAAAGETSGAIRRVEAQPVERQVLLIGADSLDWRIADPLIRQGRMPRLAALLERGARANLRTISPILSPVIWTSIATGVKPSRHGIVDFVVTASATGEPIPVTSAMRQVPALWTLLSRQGVDVSVVAWWATWPAETVRGSIVTDRVAYQLFEEEVKEDWKTTDPARNRGKTFPPELIDEIRPLIRAPGDVTDDEVAWFLAPRRAARELRQEQRELLNSFRTVIAAGDTYHAIALRLFRSSPARLKMVYYEGPDTTSHLFMRFRPPLLAGVSRADMDLFGGIVDRYYERLDRYVGELVDEAGESATVILLSDHGFKSDTNRPPYSDPRIGKGDAAGWHTPVGVLVMAGPDIRSGLDLGSASVLDIVPTVLALFGLPAARDMDGQPLTEAIAPAFLDKHPVAWIDSYGGFREPPGQVAGAGAAGDREMVEKLRSLGYIGDDRMTAHNNRGIMALDEGDPDAAIPEFERALADGGGAAPMIRANLARAWLQKGDLEKASAAAAQALAEDPRNKQAEMILGGVAIKKADLAAAERHFQRAIAIDPAFAPAHSKLGEVHLRRGQEQSALADFRKAVDIAPLGAVEHNNIGNIYRKLGQIERAMEAYRDALRADPQYIGAYNNLGLCLQERGRLKEARALYDKALAIRPENPILRNSLGTLCALKGDRKEALAQFERAVKGDPGWAVAQGNMATLLFEEGRVAEAKGAFEKLVELEPESAEARLNLALALLMAQEWKPARDQLEEVLRRDPRNLRARVALGETLLRTGDLEGAQSQLEQAVRLESNLPRVYNSLGEVYLQRGLKKEAARAFLKSLAIEPQQEAIRQRLAEARR